MKFRMLSRSRMVAVVIQLAARIQAWAPRSMTSEARGYRP